MGFSEQTPYLEWRNSIYSDEDNPENPEAKTCQACHQPTLTKMGTYNSYCSPPGGDFRINPRALWTTYLCRCQCCFASNDKAERETLNPLGTDAALDNISILQWSANLLPVLEDLEQSETLLSFTVKVESFMGHKLPTGFPLAEFGSQKQLMLKMTSCFIQDAIIHKVVLLMPQNSD